MDVWIGVGIWLAVMVLWGLMALRRRSRLKRNPPPTSAQQLWDEASPEAKSEASRSRAFWTSYTGSGPS